MKPKNPRDRDEVISLVCDLFLNEKLSAKEVAEKIKKEPGLGTFTRFDVYDMLDEAREKDWLQITTPRSARTESELKKRFGFLRKSRVVRTCISEDVSNHIADELFEILRNHDQDTINLGIAGGSLLRRAMKRFATLIRENPKDVPPNIVLHSLVAGFNVDDPTTDPNSFFQFFHADVIPSAINVRFVSLNAPGLVLTDKLDEMRQNPVVRTSLDRVKEIDVFVTSAGGHWDEKEAHSMLFNMFKQLHGESLEQLKAAEVVGDLMWLPFSRASLNIHSTFRTMTLLDLSDLPQMVEDKKKVILGIAPCGHCGSNKGEILRTIFEHSQRKPLITHLVADFRSVEAAL